MLSGVNTRMGGVLGTPLQSTHGSSADLLCSTNARHKLIIEHDQRKAAAGFADTGRPDSYLRCALALV